MKKRKEIEDKYKWDLTPIYKTEDEWKKDYEEVKNEIEKVKDFKNTFLKDGELNNIYNKGITFWHYRDDMTFNDFKMFDYTYENIEVSII